MENAQKKSKRIIISLIIKNYKNDVMLHSSN